MPPKSRKELSLKDKVQLIRNSEGKTHRQLAEKYGIGKTQVGTILKRKAEFMSAIDDNENQSRKRVRVNSNFEDVDDLTWQWFQRLRGMNMPVAGH